MRKLLTKIFGIATLALCLVQFASAQAKQWDPQRTWAFMVCLVEWKDGETWAPFPKEIRKDGLLRDTLKKRGVPSRQIVYIEDRAATTASVERQFTEFLKKPAPGDWIFVYFEGHGDRDEESGEAHMITYDAGGRNRGWKFDSIPTEIERHFRGSHAVIALDNCFSGAMADSVNRLKKRVSYGVFASSLGSEVSTGNWTFTEALIAAFAGESHVDLDGSGSVTFAEMGKNSEQDMLFGEEQMATVLFTGEFNPQTAIGPAAKRASPRIGERVEAYSIDGWYRGMIIDTKTDKFLIHYYGYQQSDDEWVTARMIRQADLTSPYKIGEQVEVEWKDEWVSAQILAIKGGSHHIKYDYRDMEETEWVPSKRIRKVR